MVLYYHCREDISSFFLTPSMNRNIFFALINSQFDINAIFSHRVVQILTKYGVVKNDQKDSKPKELLYHAQ